MITFINVQTNAVACSSEFITSDSDVETWSLCRNRPNHSRKWIKGLGKIKAEPKPYFINVGAMQIESSG